MQFALECYYSHKYTHHFLNQGCGHSRLESENEHLEGHAFGFKDSSSKFRTIMAYNCKEKWCPRIQHFSTNNPNIQYDQSIIGDALHDNVKQINSVSTHVASFRNSAGYTNPLVEPTGSPIMSPSPTTSPTGTPTSSPTLTLTSPPTEHPTKSIFPKQSPTDITCNTNDVIFSVEVETDGYETDIIWYFTNIRKEKVSHHSTDFKSFDKVNMCAWSGNCYTFTINGAGHHVQYKVYVDGEIVVSGTTFDKIAIHNISVDRKKKFNIGSSQQKGCFWLKRKEEKVGYFCDKYLKLRDKCPETCGTCNF